jgi:hypothetical protein
VVAIDVDGKMALPAARLGTNVLSMTIEGARAGDDVQLVEDCGDGKTLVLRKKFVGRAPGGSDPVVSFRIHAS